MRIVIGSDHRGVEAKRRLTSTLADMGHQVADVGPDASDSVDYPDYAYEVGSRVSKGDADRGVLICGTGIGMCIAANKVRGVRAASCHDTIAAEMCRRHNDANVLCLGAQTTGLAVAKDCLKVFLATPFAEGRHAPRVRMLGE